MDNWHDRNSTNKSDTSIYDMQPDPMHQIGALNAQ